MKENDEFVSPISYNRLKLILVNIIIYICNNFFISSHKIKKNQSRMIRKNKTQKTKNIEIESKKFAG